MCHETEPPLEQSDPTFYLDLQAAHFLGMDIDDGQLQKASENIDFAELESRLNLLKASSTSKNHVPK